MSELTERDWWTAALTQANAERDEWHRQNGLLRGELAAATARAERAEAALAELRETLAAQLDAVGDRVANSEAAQGDDQSAVMAIAQAGTYHVAAWMLRNPDATWSTALEPAAEGPVRCGAECSEGHTYEPGSCEAAVDPDKVIAQNHRDAMRDWSIADE